MRAFTFVSASAALISLSSFETISLGVLFRQGQSIRSPRRPAEFAHGRNVQQRIGATRRSPPRRAASGPDELDRCRDRGKADLHLPADEIGEHVAAIQDVDHVDPGHRFE